MEKEIKMWREEIREPLFIYFFLFYLFSASPPLLPFIFSLPLKINNGKKNKGGLSAGRNKKGEKK